MECPEIHKNMFGVIYSRKRFLPALAIVLGFLAVSVLWLFISDHIVNTRLSDAPWGAGVNLATVKALLYFSATGLFLYLGINPFQQTIEKSELRKV